MISLFSIFKYTLLAFLINVILLYPSYSTGSGVNLSEDIAIELANKYTGFGESKDFSKVHNIEYARIEESEERLGLLWPGYDKSLLKKLWVVKYQNICLNESDEILLPSGFWVFLDANSGSLVKIISDTISFAELSINDSALHPNIDRERKEFWSDTTLSKYYGFVEYCPEISLIDIFKDLKPEANTKVYQFSAILVDYSRPLMTRGVKWILDQRGTSDIEGYQPFSYSIYNANTGAIEYFRRKLIKDP